MKKYLSMTTALMSACVMPAFSSAQTAPAVTPIAQNSEVGLPEIVVTAQRRTESSQKAALAIDVISAKNLIQSGVTTATSLNASVPALLVTELGGANTSYFIRGVGNFTGNAFSDPAIAFSLDGVYLGRPTSTVGTFYDLERVEVLKGPQGTLYGRNATGGAINVLPNKPKLGELSSTLSAGYGNYNAIDLEAVVNAPVGDTTAIRVAGKYAKHDGYNSDGTDTSDAQAVRLQLLTKPSDDFSVRLAFDYSHNGGAGAGGNYTGSLQFAPGTPASPQAQADYIYVPANLPPRIGFFGAAAQNYFSNLVVGAAFINPGPLTRPSQSNNYFGFSAEFNLKTELGTITFIPAYRDSKLNTLFNGPSFRGALNDEHDKQYSFEARFQGKSIGPIDWLIGGFYYDEKINAQYTFDQYFVQSYQQFTTGTKSLAGFGRITAHVNDKLRFVAGLRYTHDKKLFDGTATTVLEQCNNPPPPFGSGCFGGPSVPLVKSLDGLRAASGLTLAPFTPEPFGPTGNTLMALPFSLTPTTGGSLPINKATYRLAAEYDLAPKVLLYASYETGFRSGGFSTAAGYETYKPESIAAITLGVKSRFLDNRAQLNVELFRWKYKDQQISHFGTDAQGGTNLFTENIGRATIQGADIDAHFLVVENTLLHGSLQFLDSKLNSFKYINAGGDDSPTTPVTGCGVTSQNLTVYSAVGAPPVPFTGQALAPGIERVLPKNYAIDCSGKPESNSPKWSINAGIEQTFNIEDMKLVLNGDMRYRSNRITGFEYLVQQNSGSDVTFDAAATLGGKNDRWALTGYIHNIGNKQVVNNTQFLGSNGNTITTQYAAPRVFGVRISSKF